MKKKKQYWYCLSYIGRTDNMATAYYCAYVGCNEKDKITMQSAMSKSDLKDAVLLSVSYLGYMTKEEFTG